MLTKEESFWLTVLRLNRTKKITEIKKVFSFGQFRIEYHWRSKDSLWGRFGGGWNWEFGMQAGGNTIILNCLVFSLRFWKETKRKVV